MSKRVVAFCGAIVCILVVFLAYTIFFKRIDPSAEMGRLVVPQSFATSTTEALIEQGFIEDGFAMHLALLIRGKASFAVEAGGYRISKSQTIWEISKILIEPPVMRWVKFREGLRKEQIADILANQLIRLFSFILLRDELGWSLEQENYFIKVSTTKDKNRLEGVYFPDTYLIPLEETPDEVALRLQRRFDEKFAPLAKEALKKNIKWTTAVTIASLIQRDITGNEEDGWWGKVSSTDKKINSPFNTYMYKGLPPHPIANPGFDALNAAINPEKTKCFFYLHAPDKKIYCAVTFAEHKENIEKYLRN